MRGFKSRINKGNGFYVAELHYTADPAKRGVEWKRAAMNGMSQKDWDNEMELSWEHYSGQPVFASEFNLETNVLKERREPDPDFPILRGWDFGGNHAVITAQVISNRMYLIDEWPALGYNTRNIAKKVISECNQMYPNNDKYIDYIDPSGLYDNSKAAEGRACAEILRDVYEMDIVPGIQSVRTRLDCVMSLLTTMQGGLPNLLVNPEMPVTIQAFQGAYAYPEQEKKNVKVTNPEKSHPYSDVMDCIQYIATRATSGAGAGAGDAFVYEFDDGAVDF